MASPSELMSVQIGFQRKLNHWILYICSIKHKNNLLRDMHLINVKRIKVIYISMNITIEIT